MERDQKVEVISVCDTGGSLRPLRVRFEGEDHQLYRMDIDQVLSVREVSYVGIEAFIFLCRVHLEERERVLELKYTIRTHCWSLLRWVV